MDGLLRTRAREIRTGLYQVRHAQSRLTSTLLLVNALAYSVKRFLDLVDALDKEEYISWLN
jgi:hypothetical protein